MYTVDWIDIIQGKIDISESVAITIGVFDGVHTGHQRLIQAITDQPDKATPCVVTFKSNPVSVLKNRPFLGSIFTPGQKLTKLELFGIRLVILIDFSYEFSKITGRDFWLSLFGRLKVIKMAVGQNFLFGHKRKSNVETLIHLSPGVIVDVVEPVHYKGKTVSSTRIRTLIQHGEFKDVEAMLGANYELDLSGVDSIHIKGDICEIDLKRSSQVIPENGNYSALLKTDTGDFSCILNIMDGMFRWKKNADYTNIKNIIFKGDENAFD